MNAFIFFARVGIILSLCINSPAVYAFKQDHFNDRNHYVVIGAFAQKEHAVKFTTDASRYDLKAEYDMNPNRNLYYVFVLITPELNKAVDEALRIRKASPFSDTWVYHGLMGSSEIVQTPANVTQQNAKGRDINPVTQQEISDVSSQQDSVQKIADKDTTIVSGPPLPSNNGEAFPVGEVKPFNLPIEEIPSKNFVFQIYRAVDTKYVNGDVDVIDVEKTRKMASYKGNTSVKVAGPPSKSGNVTFNCEVFGYRKQQKDFSFKTQSKEAILMDEAQNIVIPFELVRLQRGDIGVMYNVYFFKDAAIMRPESRYEVTSLLGMLKENLAYKIKLHGHTNGNAHGKIISMSDTKNYFSLTDSRDGFGSAKKLSEERANCIRDFLISNDIDESRIQIKAWGGKRPIHDKHAAMAHENVRVEVEILEN
jgi:outer membrane protein OmpA-like peptidoglycan-associated protein